MLIPRQHKEQKKKELKEAKKLGRNCNCNMAIAAHYAKEEK